MAPVWRQYLEAGMHVGEMTRAEAQKLVRQLVKEGQVAEERARTYVDELVSRSRRRTEELRALVRREIESQLSSLGLATKADLAELERKLAKASTTARRPAGSKRAPAKKAGAASKARPTRQARKPSSK